MNLTTEQGHRALAYVDAVQRQGYLLTVAEFEAYINYPGRDPGFVHEPRLKSASLLAGKAVKSLQARGFFVNTQGSVQPVPLEDARSPESVTDWLVRLSWLAVSDDRVRITALGAAVLSSLERQSFEEDVPVAVVLDRGDPIAGARVIGKLAEVRATALVDPYFSIDTLMDVVQATEIERVLTSRRDERKAATLALAMAGLDAGRPFEVRVSDAFHDRFAVPDTGPVWMLGTSLTGVGKRLALMIELSDDGVAGAIRGRVEHAWSTAAPLVEEPPGDVAGRAARRPTTLLRPNRCGRSRHSRSRSARSDA